MSNIPLSKADSKVLAKVFDPESGPARVEILVNQDLPQDRYIHDAALLGALRAQEKKAIAIIEESETSRQPEAAKDDAYRTALAILNDIVENHPEYASARNNRAQLRRWRFGDRNTLCQKRSAFEAERRAAGAAAVQDLHSTIILASPARQKDTVSPVQGRLLAQSYTQLGALYYAASKDFDSASDLDVMDLDGSVWSRDSFEEEASKLFYLGGLYGNEVAKALAVRTNPHAKLCGSIVKEAMRKELATAQ